MYVPHDTKYHGAQRLPFGGAWWSQDGADDVPIAPVLTGQVRVGRDAGVGLREEFSMYTVSHRGSPAAADQGQAGT
jgi:hypothetical protein